MTYYKVTLEFIPWKSRCFLTFETLDHALKFVDSVFNSICDFTATIERCETVVEKC